MRSLCLKAGLLTAALVCATACANALTVTVSPDTMGDWSIATNNGGTADLAAYGSPVYERANAWTADDGTPLGRGAVYMSLEGKYDGTGSTSWLGLDRFNGAPLAGTTLSSITKLEYYAYVGHIPTMGPASWTSWTQYYKYPQQPISLQITAEDPTNPANRRTFWWLPWGAIQSDKPESIRGDNSGRYCTKWLRYDCINFNNPDANMGGRWYQPGEYATYGNDANGKPIWTELIAEEMFPTSYGSSGWAGIVAEYGNWKLVATSTDSYPTGWKSAGWAVDPNGTNPPGAPTCTATGKCINFEWGARKTTNQHIFYQDNTTWENFYQLGKGCVDHFTLGVNGVNVTYDFEPAANAKAPEIVCINNKAAYDAVIHRPSVQQRQLVKIVGKVVPVLGEAAWFAIGFSDSTDDSTDPLRIRGLMSERSTGLRPADMWDGAWWSVWGYMERMPFEPADGPMLIWTIPEHMTMMKQAGP